MGYSRQWLIDTLRGLGFDQAADDALADLPEEFDYQQLERFADQHGVSRGELVDRMGGSP
jgi:hypothetical protein